MTKVYIYHNGANYVAKGEGMPNYLFSTDYSKERVKHRFELLDYPQWASQNQPIEWVESPPPYLG